MHQSPFANWGSFFISIDGNVFDVMRFSLSNFGLSRGICIKLQFFCPITLSTCNLLAKNACLEVHKKGKASYFSGLVTEIANLMSASPHGYRLYSLKIECTLKQHLSQPSASLFCNTDDRELIDNVLKEVNFPQTQYQSNLKPGKKKDVRGFYNESIDDFFHRELFLNQINYTSCHNEKGVTYLFSENLCDFYESPPIKLNYIEPNSQALDNESTYYSIETHACVSTATTTTTYYDSLNAHKTAIDNTYEKGYGIKQYNGFKNSSETFAEINNVKHITIKTFDALYLPGQLLEIDSKIHRVSNISIEGVQITRFDSEQGPFFIAPKLTSSVSLAPLTKKSFASFIEPTDSTCFFSGEIEAPRPPYPNLNADGHYHAHYSFDKKNETLEGLSGIRKAGYFTGFRHDGDFPLHNKTKVIMATPNTIGQKPLILGAAPTADSPSPVTKKNRHENILCSWSGNTLKLNDSPKNPSVELHTHQKQNILSMTQNTGLVNLISNQGEFHLQSGEDFKTEGKKHVSLKSNSKIKKVVNKTLCIESLDGHREMWAAKNIFLHSEKCLKAITDKIELKAKSNILLHTKGSMTLKTDKFSATTKKKNIELSAPTVCLKVKTINIRCGETTFSLDQGKMVLTSPQTIITGFSF